MAAAVLSQDGRRTSFTLYDATILRAKLEKPVTLDMLLNEVLNTFPTESKSKMGANIKA
jgi:hypothetical protein